MWVAKALDPDKKKLALKAFRDLWVAGTVGGFLAALMRSVPVDINTVIQGASAIQTFDLGLRYAYMLWFVAYFLVSNLNKEKNTWTEVLFDMIQSLAAYWAAFALGITVHDAGLKFDSSAAFLYANGAVLTISFVSLVLFGKPDRSRLDVLRVVGAVVAVAGIVFADQHPLGASGLAELMVVWAILGILVFLFARLRIEELPAAERIGRVPSAWC